MAYKTLCSSAPRNFCLLLSKTLLEFKYSLFKQFHWETLQKYCASLPNASLHPNLLLTADLQRPWGHPMSSGLQFVLAVQKSPPARCLKQYISLLFFPPLFKQTQKDTPQKRLIDIKLMASHQDEGDSYSQGHAAVCERPLGEGLNGNPSAVAIAAGIINSSCLDSAM